MRLFITCDANWEAKLDKVLSELVGLNFRHFFELRSYGEGLQGVSVVLMCRDPSLSFSRRIKWSRKDKNLHLDIMFNSPTVERMTHEERKREVAQRLYDEVPDVLAGYKIPDFDKDAFVTDFRAWIDSIGWR